MESPILPGNSFSVEKQKHITDQFFNTGFVHIPNVLAQSEVEALRDRADQLLDDPVVQQRYNPNLADPRYVQLGMHKTTNQELPFILRNTIELDQMFRDILLREPIFSLAQRIVGEDCKFCGQNILRNQPGLSIDNWHVDGSVHFPVADDMKRHDKRLRMPVMWFTVQMALSDIELIEHGPTQYVPQSHYSGRHPENQDNPNFEGNEPISIFCRAGDIYLQDPQCWHRGAPNDSNRTRYVLQSQYAANWAYWRFSLCNSVPLPDNALQSASSPLLKLLGKNS
mgnify:CR=1 FL=1